MNIAKISEWYIVMSKHIFFVAGFILTLCSTAHAVAGGATDDDRLLYKEACIGIAYSRFCENQHVVYGAKLGACCTGKAYHRLYGVSAVLIDIDTNEEIVGCKCGLLNWCSLGCGVMVGVMNFTSDFTGVDVGMFNCFAARSRSFLTSEVSGLMLGVVNVNESHFALQTGVVNAQSLLENGFSAQLGVWNSMCLARRSRGMQIGLYNDAELEEASVLQIGPFNCVRQDEGKYVQIGILNCSIVEDSKCFLPMLSIGF